MTPSPGLSRPTLNSHPPMTEVWATKPGGRAGVRWRARGPCAIMAVTASLAGFPAWIRAWYLTFRSGLKRAANNAGKECAHELYSFPHHRCWTIQHCGCRVCEITWCGGERRRKAARLLENEYAPRHVLAVRPRLAPRCAGSGDVRGVCE